MPDLLTESSRAASRPAVTPPPAAPPRPDAGRRSRVLAGVNAAVCAAAVGLLFVELISMLSWAFESRSAAPLSAALRTGAAFWLLGHGGRLHLSGGAAGLMPLGLTLMFVALCGRAGASVARVRPTGPRRRTLLACGLAVSVPYAVIAAAVAGASIGGGLRISVLSVLIGSLLLAAVSAAAGAARELPMASPRRTRSRAVAGGVCAAAGALLAVAALVAAASLLAHISDATALARPTRAGVAGGLGLFTLQAALAPNAIVWTGSYLLGPGFAIGSGTLISPTGLHLRDLPALPMLAGLPSSTLIWPLYVLFLTPVAAGALAGIVVLRRIPRTPSFPLAAALGASVGLALGALAGAVAVLSGGPVAGGRLATVGPAALPTALSAALEVGVPCMITMLALTWRKTRPRRSAADEAAVQAAEAAEAAASAGSVPSGGVRHSLRRAAGWPRRRVARLGHGVASRLGGFGTGLSAGLGLDRLVGGLRARRARRRPESAEQAEQITQVLIDERPVVDLTKSPKKSAPETVGPLVSLTKQPAAAPELGQEAAEQEPKRRRIHVPSRLKRKSKVIKLPD